MGKEEAAAVDGVVDAVDARRGNAVVDEEEEEEVVRGEDEVVI